MCRHADGSLCASVNRRLRNWRRRKPTFKRRLRLCRRRKTSWSSCWSPTIPFASFPWKIATINRGTTSSSSTSPNSSSVALCRWPCDPLWTTVTPWTRWWWNRSRMTTTRTNASARSSNPSAWGSVVGCTARTETAWTLRWLPHPLQPPLPTPPTSYSPTPAWWSLRARRPPPSPAPRPTVAAAAVETNLQTPLTRPPCWPSERPGSQHCDPPLSSVFKQTQKHINKSWPSCVRPTRATAPRFFSSA